MIQDALAAIALARTWFICAVAIFNVSFVIFTFLFHIYVPIFIGSKICLRVAIADKTAK